MIETSAEAKREAEEAVKRLNDRIELQRRLQRERDAAIRVRRETEDEARIRKGMLRRLEDLTRRRDG